MSIKRACYVACGLFLVLFLAAVASLSGPQVASSESLLTNNNSAPVVTPTPGPSCVSVTGSTPRCFWPNTMSYYFGLYNSCNVALTGSGVVKLELAPTSSGPWTVYNQQTVNPSLPPGSSYTSGNFVENNIPPEYRSYRFTLILNTNIGQTLNSTTVAAPLCNTPGTPIPTPTGITIRCSMSAAGAQSTCSQPDTYSYDFGIYSHCDTTMYGTVVVQLQVSADQGGPWTTYDTRTSSRSYSPGVNSVQGIFTEPYIPSQYQWYRITMSASYPGPFGNRYVTSETQPAPICTGSSTATVTPTISPTQPTASPTPTSCPNNYNYTVSTSTIVSGTTLVAGSQCGGCIVNVALPFPFAFYGQTYTSANLSTQGNLQFTTTHLGPNACPLPEPLLGPAMMPHWDETLDMSFHTPCEAYIGSPCGIYTSVSGSAPNRVFNVHWRARFIGTNQHTANFEARLYENSTYFEYIYGWVSYTGGYASIGVQDGGCRFTSYSCNTWNNIQPGTLIGWGGLPGGTTTPIVTGTPATSTRTSTPTVSPTGTIVIVDAVDLVGDLFWATSCPAPVLRLTSRNIGFPVTVPPSTMRVTTNSGDFREFPVPSFNGSYSVDCEMGTCIPPSWSFDLPLTLRVDYHNTVQERNENNNITQLNNPPPAPTPCGPTSTPTHTITSTPTGTLTVTPCPIQFSDVDHDNTFYLSIRCLACKGIVSGYNDGTFRPNNQVTRGQLAKMVSNAAGFYEPASGQTFQDVPPTHTFYEVIQRLTTRGYMTGYACGSPGEPCINNRPYFRPQANATRGQTSKIVANAAQIETPIPPDRQTFQDVPPNHTFWLWIERLVTRNVMGGYNCGGLGEPCIAPENRPYFRPGNDVTRGQSSKIVANTFFPNCNIP